MTASLITYLFAVSVLVAIAALGAEATFGRLSLPKRAVWIGSLLVSLTLPLSIALMTPPVEATIALPPIPVSQPVAAARDSIPDRSRVVPADQPEQLTEVVARSARNIGGLRWRVPSLDSALGMGWMCFSFGTVLFYVLAWMRLSCVANRCPRIDLEGVAVRQTEHVGPAVFGFLRPVILVPHWLLAAPAEVRSLALRHEGEHIAARDPLLLLVGMLLVALAPWNLALWWQLRRLRFAIEADCDARLLRDGANLGAYTEALLAVGTHRSFVVSHLMALTTRASWLERRVRLMVTGANGISRFAAASGAALAAGVIAAAMFLQAPGLAAPADLRKLPPQDTMPAAVTAVEVARSKFPELFDQPIEGTAVVAVLFNHDGSVRLANKHLFPSGEPPSDLDMTQEDQSRDIDPSDDIFYGSYERPDSTIGPWIDSKNPGRLLIVYQVLRWPPDATRGHERVQKALELYNPELLKSSHTQQTGELIQLTVFMNEDGTVNREQKRVVHVGESITEDQLERFAAMGVSREQLGRMGFVGGLTQPTNAPLSIDYAWPRRADDPADVAALHTEWREIEAAHPPKRDDHDDAAIVRRYFPQVQERGKQAVTETSAGRESLMSPWILFGRDGRVWETGFRHNEDGHFRFGMNDITEMEARYPGVIVSFPGGTSNLRVNGVPITAAWVAAESPIQRKQDVDLRKRKDILLTSTLVDETPLDSSDPMLRNPFALHFTSPMNFGEATAVEYIPKKPWVQVTASSSGPQGVTLRVSTRDVLVAAPDQPASSDWLPAATVHVSYGSAATVHLFDRSFDVPRKVRLVLRPQLLGGAK